MKASEVVFQELLNGKIQYVIPLYQRTYSWEEEQWEQLWDDLLEVYVLVSPKNHFIGSVVTQQVPSSPEETSRYTLIDGQQRMTTLFILLSVIQKHSETENGTQDRLAEEIKETCLTNKFGVGDERIKLIPSQRDRDAFAAVVNGLTAPSGTQIGKVQAYFGKVLKECDRDGNEIDLRNLYRCIVNHLDMVSIRLDQNDSPNRIFESLNNTGMALSVADLIRNYLLMNIKNPEHQEQAYNEYWYPMEQLFAGGTKDVAADFFWHYLMMKGSLPRKDETYDEIQKRFDPHTPARSVEALKDFAKFSCYYAQLAGIKTSNLDSALSEQIDRLNQWQVAVSYPFLMKAMDNVASGNIKQDELVEVIRLVESFVVRRAVCSVPTNQLRRIFAQMSEQRSDEDIVGFTRKHLSENRWPSDDDFRSAFVNFRLYIPSRLNRTRLVLNSLEASFGHKESPELKDGITIEHIMPQTLSDEWREDLGSDATDVHNQWLDTVGNLTLTGYNSELSNKPFAEKKVALAESNFALNAKIDNFEVWNEKSIQRRAGQLAECALKIWKR